MPVLVLPVLTHVLQAGSKVTGSAWLRRCLHSVGVPSLQWRTCLLPGELLQACVRDTA